MNLLKVIAIQLSSQFDEKLDQLKMMADARVRIKDKLH